MTTDPSTDAVTPPRGGWRGWVARVGMAVQVLIVGAVAIAANTVTGSLLRNSVAVAEAMSRGAPTSPSTGMSRGTRSDRYSR